MPVRIDHIALAAHDAEASAQFLADILGLPDPYRFGPFIAVDVNDQCTVDYAAPPIEFPGQHVAFHLSEEEFDDVLARVRERGVTFWAEPGYRHEGEFNTNHGGRGLYFDDPGGHHFEVLTQRYGSNPGGG